MNKNTNEPSNGVNRSLKVRSYVLLGLFLAVGCGLLIWRLYTWQIVRHDEMLNAAASQQMKDMTITPQRGQIYDATGKVLAKSSIVWTITADPSQIKAPSLSEEELEAMGGTETDESKAQRRADRVQSISEDLAGILSMDAQEIYDKLIDSSKQYVLLAKQVDKPVADEISQYASDNKLSLIVSQDTKREYPFGAFAASVLGFMHADGYGFYGLEQYYEDVLAGTPGRLVSQRTPTGGEVANDDRVLYEAKDGDNLILTLDAEIQAIAEKYLENSVKVNNVSERGVVIVMDVNTGAILAMATKPDFDPNDPMTIYDPERAALLEGLDGEEYTKVQGEERQRQWKNKTITDLYTPGSVFKLITTSALLDSGTATVNTTFNCTGSYTVMGTDYSCADNGYGVKGVHGWQNLGQVLENSCNIATIQEAQLMGKEIFSDYYTAFGFTEPTGIDLPAEQYPREGVSYHSVDTMSAVDLASSSFGQAQKVTPIQMATAVCAVVNGGYLVQPHIVSKIVDNEGNVVEEFEPTAKRQVISEETSAALRSMMEDVVGGGADGAAGRNAYVAGYHIGGKSGTSEKLDQGPREGTTDEYEKVSSFVGVVPIDDPQILVLAFVDEPHAETEFGSMLSAPLVGNIISEVAPYLGIETDPSLLPTGNVTVPNLVNPSNPSYQQWDMAQVELNKKGFAHRRVGTGELVLAQSPAAGEKVPAGSTVYLFTDSADIPTVTVPSVVGKSAALAKQILSAAGLNASLSAEEGTVTAQSVAENTEAKMGSVIELTVSGAEG